LLLRPAEQLRPEPGELAPHRDPVHVPRDRLLFVPEGRILPAQRDRPRNGAVRPHEVGLTALVRRLDPTDRERMRPLLDPARAQPRRRLGEHSDHLVDLLRPSPLDLHNTSIASPKL
jgi:hypothetical protein